VIPLRARVLPVLALLLAACPARKPAGEVAAEQAPGLETHCQDALRKAQSFGGVGQLGPAAIQSCVAYYQAASEAQRQVLACYTGAATQAVWDACQERARAALPEASAGQGGTPVSLALHTPESVEDDDTRSTGHFSKSRQPMHGGLPVNVILGSLAKERVDEVIRDNLARIKACYQQGQARDATLKGKVVVKFVIAKTGAVSSAAIKTSTMGDPETEQCLVDVLLGLQFPEPSGGGIVIVSYPFLFEPG